MGTAAAIGAGISALTGLIGGNQARQDRKHAMSLADQAVNQATSDYASKGAIRTKGLADLTNPQSYDYSSVYGGGPSYESVNDPLVSQGSDAQSKGLADLMSSPDRIQAAKDALANFDAEAAPQKANAIRSVGQDEARFGRLGSGMAASRTGSVASDFQRSHDNAMSALIQDELSKIQSDKMGKIDAAGNVTNAAYGRASSERANKQGVAQQGVSNRAAQLGAERASQGQDYSQGMGLADLGYSGSPVNAINQAANIYSGSSAQNAAGAADAMGAAGRGLAGLFSTQPQVAPSFDIGQASRYNTAVNLPKIQMGSPLPQ